MQFKNYMFFISVYFGMPFKSECDHKLINSIKQPKGKVCQLKTSKLDTRTPT